MREQPTSGAPVQSERGATAAGVAHASGSWSRWVPVVAGATVLLLAALVLVGGWWLGLGGLKRVSPGWAPMMPATAVAFLLLALGLVAVGHPGAGNRTRRWGRAGAGLGFALGAVVLAEYALGVDLGVDRLLFGDRVPALPYPNPGRPAPDTALGIAFVGGALLLAEGTGRRILASQLFAGVAAVIGLQALVGYAYILEGTYRAGELTPIALHSAAGLMVLAAGVLFVRPAESLMRTLTGDGLGGVIARRLLIAGVLIPFLLGLVRVAGERAGVIEGPRGTAWLVIGSIILFVVVAWSTGRLLDRLEGASRETASALRDQVARTEEARTALQLRDEQFRTLADSIPQLAWMADPQGWIFWYNRRWFDYTGTTLDEMQGWGWRAVHHPDHIDRVVERVQRAWDTGEPWEDTFPLRGRDGVYRWFLSRALPIRDAEGNVVRWFGTNTDVTEQRDAAEERERLLEGERAAREAAEAANVAKSQFISVMSHELRTPLSGIIGYADLLANGVFGPLSAEQHRSLERMVGAARHLVSIIDEILIYARTEAGREELRTQTVDVAALARESADLMAVEAQACGLRLSASIPDSPLELRTDPGKVRQILLNLLGNAIKFTDRGGVELVVEPCAPRAEADRDTPPAVAIHVRDTGPGIRKSELERIFEPFTQLDQSRTREKGGTGLGLTVSRRLARLLGGDVRVASTPGTGSTFTVELPSLPADEPPAAARADDGRPGADRGSATEAGHRG